MSYLNLMAEIQDLQKKANDLGRRECAWCKQTLGFATWLKFGEVTHGICESCSARVKSGMALDFAQYSRAIQLLHAAEAELSWLGMPATRAALREKIVRFLADLGKPVIYEPEKKD